MSRRRLASDVVVVDVGNSKIEISVVAAGRIASRVRLPTRGRPARLAAALRAALAAPDVPGLLPMLVASVVPGAAETITGIARRCGLRQVHRLSWDDPWPFAIAVRNPSTLGVDRLANIAGLCALGHQDGIAIDVGTAITIDVLRGGRFEGGLILPGFDLQLGALHARTAALPGLEWSATAPRVGRDTVAALQAGVLHPTAAGVAAVAARLGAELPALAAVILTGGAAFAVAPWLAGRAREEPGLMTLGLRTVAARLGFK